MNSDHTTALPAFSERTPSLPGIARQARAILGAAALSIAAAAPVLAKEPTALAVARAHIEAWNQHDYAAAQTMLAEHVHVTVSTTLPIMAPTDLKGIDQYMVGLKKFAETVVPGSARIIRAEGDAHNALILVGVKASFGPGAPKDLIAARLYRIDDDNKIAVEQVVFYIAE